ncbi:MAG: DUF1929 domain-containing protein [Solirubrobacterales bacterium]|nr:DUF1929 domain-containing protein [Solirubrobacterales bacterium]
MDTTSPTSVRRRLRQALGAVAAVALIVPGTALAHGKDDPAGTGMSERTLRTIEQRLLGNPTPPSTPCSASPASAVGDPVRARRAVAHRGPDEVGAWEAPRTIVRAGDATRSVPAIHSILLRTGQVLMYGYPIGSDSSRVPRNASGAAVLFDPATGTFEDVNPPIDPRTGKPALVWCSGASLLPDGRVLTTGGYFDYNEANETKRNRTGEPLTNNVKGLNHVYTFDPVTKRWQRHENLGGGNDPADVTGGRWYPSQMLMPDGRTFIIHGLDESGFKFNEGLEVFDPTKPLGQEVSRLSPDLPSSMHGDYYPHTFWMPSGRGLIAGPFLKNSFNVRVAGLRATLDDVAEQSVERRWGTNVLMPLRHDATSGSVLQLGGAPRRGPSDALSSAEGFDETTGRWSARSSMQVRRAHHNTVLLPDRSMVTIGGGLGIDANGSQWVSTADQRQAEVYDPATATWKPGPVQREDRAYHSTAVLLPDGSVLSAGDDDPGDVPQKTTDTYEIYKPSYFFRGPRPQLSSAPESAGYRRTVWVGTPNTDIDRAVLVSPGAATHAVDMNQRVVDLPVRRRADGVGYDVDLPVSPNVALPGYHMLFLVDGEGRPSESRWVRLDEGAADQAPPSAADLPGGGQGGTTAPDPVPSTTGGVVRQPVVGDRRAPRVRVTLTRTRLAALRRRSGVLRLRVGLGETASARVTVTLTRVTGRRRTTIVRWTRTVRTTGSRSAPLALRPGRRQKPRLRGDVRLSVTVSATDRAGNRSRGTLARRLR